MGAVTAGIGAQFGGLGSVWNELGRAGAHALAQGGFSAMRGGDFWQGAAAGFVSSLAGSGAQSIGIHGWGMVGVSAFSGGVGAAIAGGKAEEILFGIVQGTMVGVLNHKAGEVQQKKAVEDAQLKLKAILALHGITDNSVQITSGIVKGSPTINVLLRSGGSLANLGAVLKQFKGALGPIGFTLNELSDIGKFYTGEYNVSDFMQSTALNMAAVAIPEVAIAMVFIWAIHNDPVPVNYQNPVCPKDNTNYVIRYLSH